MIYVIMCGGKYTHFEKHKALTEVNGEPLVARTIRILKKLTNDQIFITADDPEFAEYGIILPHDNSYQHDGKKASGYWLDAFYPYFLDGTEVCFIMGDVYFSEDALEKIVNYDVHRNTLFGTRFGKAWEEPLAYKVVHYAEFMNGVEEVKKLYNEGKCNRHPIIWELYRYLNGIDVNTHILKNETYIDIPRGGIDADYPSEIPGMRKAFG